MKLILILLLSTIASAQQFMSPVVYRAYDSQHNMIGAVEMDGTVIAQVGHTQKEVLKSMLEQVMTAQQDMEYQCAVQKLELLKQWKAHNDLVNAQLQKNIDKFNAVKAKGASK